MSSIKCFDVVSMVVDEASSQFGKLWTVDKYKYKVLKQYCDVIDSLVAEFDCESIDVEVDDIKMTIKISLECPEVVVYSSSHKLYELISRSVSFGFSHVNEDLLRTSIVFPSVWERT